MKVIYYLHTQIIQAEEVTRNMSNVSKSLNSK